MKRMDRYKNDISSKESRLNKNQELYQNISSNTIYTNITDVKNTNAFEINNNRQNKTSHTTREAYQQMRKYQEEENIPRVKKELEDFNYIYKKRENKVYDINSVLEEARKNRKEKDEKEEKRKLKNQSYNILSGFNKEELEKYREEKKKRIVTPEEEELRELIDTIASKTLAGEIDKETSVDLLSDLMATNMLDKVEASDDLPVDNEVVELKEEPEQDETEEKETDNEIENDKTKEEEDLSVSRQVLDSREVEKLSKELPEEEKEQPIVNDFYTRSMDLSTKDFDMSDEFLDKGLPKPVIALIVIIILAILAVAGYYIYKRFM